MRSLAALLALVGSSAADLRLDVSGSCPTAEQVRAAIQESLSTTGAQWPTQRRLVLDLEESASDLRLELAADDGTVLLHRDFSDDMGDCGARAETVGLVVARYLESLGDAGEPPEVIAPVPRRPASPWVFGAEAGALLAGGVADSAGDTVIDAGPEVGFQLGREAYLAALRVAWLPGNSFAEAGTGGAAGVDRVPITLAGSRVGRWGPWRPGAAARLVLEPMRSAGRTRGLRTDVSLAVRAGMEAELAIRLGGPVWIGLRLGLDVALRRIEIKLTNPDTLEPAGVLEQEWLVPWGGMGLSARWNLGR